MTSFDHLSSALSSATSDHHKAVECSSTLIPVAAGRFRRVKLQEIIHPSISFNFGGKYG